MKVTQSGLRVIYQPASTVYHLEGATSGTNLESGAKSYQVTNSQKLAQRWSGFLMDHRNNGEDAHNEKDRFIQKRVLFIDHAVPKPDQDAGSVTAINTMLILREFGFQVTFTTVDPISRDFEYVKLLQKLGVEVLFSPFSASLSQHLIEHGDRYNLVFSCRPEPTAEALPLVRQHCPNAPVIFHTMDLHFLRKEREAKVLQDWSSHKSSEYLKELETWLSARVDITIIHNQFEKDTLVELGVPEEKIMETPLLLNIQKHRKGFSEREGIVFVGGFSHSPNLDAISFFCDQIMPLLTKENPEIVLNIIGSNVTDAVTALEKDNVKVIGFVDDLAEVLGSARLSVAPLRYGAGVKGKVGKSLSTGTPVVGSEIAFEGMRLTEGEGFQIATNPSQFVEIICNLYSNEKSWNHISLNGHNAAKRLWGFHAAASSIDSILKTVGIALPLPKEVTRLF
jgi:glycosyltransferase involved in cell wall biosynthesis